MIHDHQIRKPATNRAIGRASWGWSRAFARIFALCIAPLIVLGGCPAPEAQSVRERSRASLVRDDSGEVRIDGVGSIVGFARGRDCTFIHCLELVLGALGRQLTYDELMAAGGMAFRMQFCTEQWDVGNSDPLVGDSRLDDVFSGVGWQYEVRIVRRDDLAEADALNRAVRRSIDNGIPVLAANVMPPEDWGIITGYRSDTMFLCRAYNGGAAATDLPATGWPTAVVILTQRRSPPVREKSRVDAIRRAISLFEMEPVGCYAQGSRAFEAWCEELQRVEDPAYVHANFWTYVCLIDARASAVRYLRSVEKDFEAGQLHISAAADLYDREVRLLLDAMPGVPSGSTFEGRMPPQEMRNSQVEALRAAMRLEEQAVANLKKAL
ncbi:MAG: hypothetical protein DCC65_07355 [Planctomycetota bacterium]|nr:MAG: hypothetical protein DCC65_07355 [Planctomycetota bacterium]